jgi:transposase
MGRRAIPIEPYIEKLVTAVSVGATYDIAAAFAGISYKTFERWRLAAETAPESSALGQLHLRLREAEGRAAVGWLAKIEAAASAGDWRAAAFKLERRYPEQYGREPVKKVALTTPDGSESYGGEGLAALLALAHRGTYATNGSTPEE